MVVQKKLEFKLMLKKNLLTILEERVKFAEVAMLQAQEAANSEDKSSVGDKYETGRAMSQNERDRNARQFEMAKHELLYLQSLDVTRIYSSFEPGAIAVCGEQVYFLSAGLGAVTIEHQKVFCLSSQAPLAVAMRNKKAGDSFFFNQKQVAISAVF
jgi:hypothetical protein